MKTTINTQMKTQSGFSLLEVMVVLAIIGGMMALVGANILGAAGDANVKTTKAQMKLIESSLNMYKMDNYRYPTTEQGLQALIEKPSSSPEAKNYKSGGYMSSQNLPTDAWGNEFLYFNDKTKYEIVSLGADSEEGGEDDGVDISSNDK